MTEVNRLFNNPTCHSEPFASCHSERSEESRNAQGRLREESRDPSLTFRVTVKHPQVNEFEVLSFIKYNGPITTSELAERFGLEVDDATTLLSRYARQGLLRELIGIETKDDVRSRVSSRELVKKYVIAGRGESKLSGLMR